MKFFYATFLLLFLNILVYGQTVDTTVASETNARFSLLELDRVPYDILTDYGYEFIDINKYDGVADADNYLSIAHYNELYNTIVSSATATGVPDINDPVVEKDEWRTLQRQANEVNNTSSNAKVILSGLSYNYNSIDPNALNDDRITVIFGSRYDDKYINGVWQNPYDSKYTFAIAAPFKKVGKASVSVQLPTTLWHTNTTATSIEIDFGEKTTNYQDIKNAVIASHTYTKAGIYTWTYRISTDGGQSYKYAHQKIEVDFYDKRRINETCFFNELNPQIVPIVATEAFNGVFGEATLEVVYGSATCQIEEPLIVVEGLDTGLLAAAGDIGDTDLQDFLQNIRDSQSQDLENLITDNTAIDKDIIYVNWNNGVDFLERNALVLQEVIAWVNANKVTTTPNIILGQSMGGVISRYALRDMEDDGLVHDTSLYISHDAPHQGAHVPLGALFMARHLIDQFIETPLGDYEIPLANTELGLIDIGELMSAPAVEQLLINTITPNLQVDNTVHNTWQTELTTTGYPQLTRNISLSNGSHCAEPQGINSNQDLLNISGSGSTSALTDIISLASPLIAVAPAIVFDDLGVGLLGLLPGNSSLSANFNIKAYPSFGSQEIYHGSITYQKTLLWLLPITKTITDRDLDSPSNILLQEDFPGGVSPFASDFIDEGEDFNTIFGDLGYSATVETSHNFISTTSALDIGGVGVIDEDDYRSVYTANGTGALPSPFDNFTTSFSNNGNNEPHISFNRANGDWLATELDATVPAEIFDCSVTCDSLEIEGSDFLCNSDTYFVDVDLASITTINWTFSNNNAVNVLNTTGADITLQAVNGYSETISLTATIQVSPRCGGGTIVVTRNNIRVGVPEIPSSLSGPTQVDTGALVTYTAGNSVGATSYKWLLPHPFENVAQYDYNGDRWQLKNPGDFQIQQVYSGMGEISGLVQVAGMNPCGEGGSQMMNVEHSTGGGGGIPVAPPGDDDNTSRTMAYPNPSRTSVNIDINNDIVGSEYVMIESIEIMDVNMSPQPFRYIETGTQHTQLDISQMKTGLYFIKVATNEGVEIKKLLVN